MKMIHNNLDLDMLSQYIHSQHQMINVAILQQQISEQKIHEKMLEEHFSTSFNFSLKKEKTYLTEINFSMPVFLILKNKNIEFFSTVTPHFLKLLFLDYKYIPCEIKFHSSLDTKNIKFYLKDKNLSILNLIFRPRGKIKKKLVLHLDNDQKKEVFNLISDQ